MFCSPPAAVTEPLPIGPTNNEPTISSSIARVLAYNNQAIDLCRQCSSQPQLESQSCYQQAQNLLQEASHLFEEVLHNTAASIIATELIHETIPNHDDENNDNTRMMEDEHIYQQRSANPSEDATSQDHESALNFQQDMEEAATMTGDSTASFALQPVVIPLNDNVQHRLQHQSPYLLYNFMFRLNMTQAQQSQPVSASATAMDTSETQQRNSNENDLILSEDQIYACAAILSYNEALCEHLAGLSAPIIVISDDIDQLFGSSIPIAGGDATTTSMVMDSDHATTELPHDAKKDATPNSPVSQTPSQTSSGRHTDELYDIALGLMTMAEMTSFSISKGVMSNDEMNDESFCDSGSVAFVELAILNNQCCFWAGRHFSALSSSLSVPSSFLEPEATVTTTGMTQVQQQQHNYEPQEPEEAVEKMSTCLRHMSDILSGQVLDRAKDLAIAQYSSSGDSPHLPISIRIQQVLAPYACFFHNVQLLPSSSVTNALLSSEDNE